LPYRVIGGVRFYERKEIRDALAYLRLAANPDDVVSLRRVINTPRRGIGDRAQAFVAALADREGISFGAALERADATLGIAPRSAAAIREFLRILADVRDVAAEGTPSEVLVAVLDQTGYLRELEASKDPQDEGRAENLRELINVTREFEQQAFEQRAAGGDALTLDAFLEQVALVADADDLPGADGGVVTLMTLHTAKGLEFPVVFLTGMEDGVFPYQKAMSDPDELAEERRLAYVGITRARQRLLVSRSLARSVWGRPQWYPPSRFLDELPAELVTWSGAVGEYAPAWGDSADDEFDTPPAWFGGRGHRGGGVAGAGQDQHGYRGRGYAGAGQEGHGYRAAPRRAPSLAAARLAPRGGRDGRGAGAGVVPELAVGDRVSNDSFGLGTVLDTRGVAEKAQAQIDFGSAGVKWLVLRYAAIEKL
ncbi:MAG: ATP-binding domain-containing protein, partial [Actinomycetia bacterium]|nr:ATP-binding domain-containing protein [Actinomycetes bacterium]